MKDTIKIKKNNKNILHKETEYLKKNICVKKTN